jgi:hypothetical protein
VNLMTYLHFLSIWRIALAALLTLIVTLPSQAAAQTHTLRVTLHDVDGRGLSGITVIVRDEEGQELARQTTDAEGSAAFVGLPAVVRVAVAGQAHRGPQLVQLGDDARGVRLDLLQASGEPHLALRVERDGLVLPDPATMLSLEESGAVVEEVAPFPTALLATPAPLPTAVATSGQPAVATDQPTEAQPPRLAWVPWLTVLIVAFAFGLLRLLQWRRDAR